MSLSVPTLISLTLNPSRLSLQNPNKIPQFQSHSTKIKFNINSTQKPHHCSSTINLGFGFGRNFGVVRVRRAENGKGERHNGGDLLKLNFSENRFDFDCSSRRNVGVGFGRNLGVVRVRAENGEGETQDGGDLDGRGESTMPFRFRYLTKEAPDTPVRWPWFIALAFLVYAWRAVLYELSNWTKALLAIVYFAGYLSKLVLALIFHFIGNPVTSLIRLLETAIYTVRSYYSSIIAYAPVPELTQIIILASTVLAISEATVPNSSKSQSYLLTLSGIFGYAAVRGVISELFFWTLLIGMYSYSRFVKKRDDVTAVLPVAAVLAAIGEPWVRVIVMVSYLALAISHNWKKHNEEKELVEEVVKTSEWLPLPLLGAALAIGIRVVVKWAGYRHLTWMIAI